MNNEKSGNYPKMNFEIHRGASTRQKADLTLLRPTQNMFKMAAPGYSMRPEKIVKSI